ncbi:hypothetical protein [Epilithonimonas sp.]|uniref:hypothetical protein n=1 Tax=Epilithonimonas sp. TaxID=2894511 RepID=UPI0028968E7A|nr:hypothetical protein [Epilithonimonas sp.]
MKNLLSLIVGLLTIGNFYAQCNITGNKIIAPNEITTFSVDAKAQCEECYLWKSSNEQAFKIEGNNKLNKVSVTGKDFGKSTISVSILTDQGLLQCEKNIELTDLKQSPTGNNCGIKIDDFKEVKVSESIISFFPNFNSGDYLYKWTVTYANGENQESAEKIPQFFYSDINYITMIKLKVSSKSPICSMTISKKYEQNYWGKTATQIDKIEQKTYSPMSYSDYVKPEDKSKITK